MKDAKLKACTAGSFLNLALKPSVADGLQRPRLESLVKEFRRIQFNWAVEHLCMPSNTVGEFGQPMLMGMAGMVKYPQAPYWYSWRMRVADFPSTAWRHAKLPCATPQQRAANIPRLSVDEQMACIKSAAGTSITTLDRMVINARKHEFTHLAIDDDLTQSLDGRDFIGRLFARLQREDKKINASKNEAREGTGLVKETRSCIVECLFLYLAEQRIAYLPLRPKAFAGDTRGLDILLLSDKTSSLWQHLIDAYAAQYLHKYEGVAKTIQGSVEQRWVPAVRNTFFAVMMASSLRSDVAESKSIFDTLAERIGAFPNKGERLRALRLLQRTIASTATGKLAPPQSHARKATLTRRFDWVDMNYTKATAGRFPQLVPRTYKPHPNMKKWIKQFVNDIKLLETKDINNVLAAYSNLLVWLAWSGRSALTLTDIVRDDINDGRLYSESTCFRAFLIQKNLTPASTNGIISRVAALFDRVIEREQLTFVNPIVIRFDLIRSSVRRGKTPRLPLGREIMTYIRDFNQRDDFAFSKLNRTHYRLICDSTTGRFERIWFPAPALLIDFLLRIPARSFQARYVDSGEGDETLPDFDNDLRYEMNLSPLATRGRREFVLTVMQGVDGHSILGLYFNTNKTSVDRALGYEVAWCDDSLRDNLLFMRDWQIRHNPIAAAIPCIERNREPENQDVKAAVQKSFPLFRDPAEPGHHPPDRASLKRYWDDLLAAVEDEINSASGKATLRLTEVKEVGKGGHRIVPERVALYDIHTLRVSGITALIEAGLPPDMVMQVAGHSTIVMTLYYNKISASRLNKALSEAIERSATKLVDAFGDDSADEFLINSRDQEDQAGLAMYRSARGRGGNTVDFMPHGICPGGECETGGEWTNQAVGYKPVPRPLACSLCRYRLTGPMFLPGLVLNANRLMQEWYAIGEQVAQLNDRINQDAMAGRSVHALKAQRSGLYHQSNAIGQEWAAEVTYVKTCERLLSDFLAKGSCSPLDESSNSLPVLSGLAQAEVVARLERRSAFSLLQSLSDGAQEWVGFHPARALIDHREFLNEILEANDLSPFLLRLSGRVRDAAANLLGRTISACVPEGDIGSLRTGALPLRAYPAVLDALASIEKNVLVLAQQPVVATTSKRVGSA